jgi:hypothetical protein
MTQALVPKLYIIPINYDRKKFYDTGPLCQSYVYTN